MTDYCFQKESWNVFWGWGNCRDQHHQSYVTVITISIRIQDQQEGGMQMKRSSKIPNFHLKLKILFQKGLNSFFMILF